MSEQRFTRRQFLSASASSAALLAGGAALSSCRSKRPDRTPDGRIILDFYNYATPEFLALYNERLIPGFEREYPHIKIRMNTSLGDAGYDAKLLTLIAGGLAPDLFHVTQQNFPFYADKNVILPLDDFLANDDQFSLEQFYPQLIEGFRVKGQLLGLPNGFSTIIMFYNQTMFDEAKLAYPDPDWTWDDYLETARKLTRGQVYGTANPNAPNRWPSWVWMNGGEIFNADMSRCLMDTPQAIAGLKYYVDLSLTEQVAPTPGESMGQDQEDLFASRRVGIIADSRFGYKKFVRGKGLPFRWDAVPMPRGPAGRATTFIWGGNCILRSTRHPKEAWQFLRFMAGKEGAKIDLEAGNGLPAVRSVAEAGVADRRDSRVPEHDHYFIDAVEYGRTPPAPPQYAEYAAAMARLQDAFLGLTSVEDACQNLTKEVNGVLSGKVF